MRRQSIHPPVIFIAILCLVSPVSSVWRQVVFALTWFFKPPYGGKSRFAPDVPPIVEKPLFLLYRNPRWIIVDFCSHSAPAVVWFPRLNESAAAGIQALPRNLCAPRLRASALR